MESQPVEPKNEEQGESSFQDLRVMDLRIQPVDGDLKDIDSSKYAIKQERYDAEAQSEPLFVPIGRISEENAKEENFEATENLEDIDNTECVMKRDTGDAEALIEPLFVPVKVEPDFEGTTEEDVVEENFEATENVEDMASGEFAGGENRDNAGVLTEPPFVPIKTEPDFEETSEEYVMAENFEATENVEDVDSSEYAMKEKTGDAEVMMPPPFVPIKSEPDFEETSEKNVTEEDFEETGNVEDMTRGECAAEQITDDAEVQMAPPYVPIKTEPEFEETSEETNMEEKYEESESTEDSPTHISSYLEVQLSVAESIKGLKEQSRQGNSEETITANGELLNQCLNPTGTSSEKNFEETVASTSYVQMGVIGEVREHTGDQRDRGSVGRSAAVSYFRAQVNEQSCEGQSSSSRKTSSKQEKVVKKPYRCDFCGKCFRAQCLLDPHVRTHTGEKPFQCALCSKAYATKGELTVHTRVHSGERPYKCSVCEKSFQTSGNLSSHLRLHSGERPYECHVCGKAFSQSGHLSAHVRSHTLEKPYRCTECGKEFSRTNVLNNHMRIHTGEKPYSCAECGKVFRESGKLARHKRIHARKHPFACQDCGSRFSDYAMLWHHRFSVHGVAAPLSYGSTSDS